MMVIKMRRILFAAAALAVAISPALADSGIRRVPCGYQQITSLTTAQKLTVPTTCGGPPTLAVIRAEAQALRYRDDGTAPTTTVGMPVLTTDPPLNYEGNLSAIQLIGQQAGAIADILFYR